MTMWKSPPPILTQTTKTKDKSGVRFPKAPLANYGRKLHWTLLVNAALYNKWTHCVRPATLIRCVHYLKNSLTLERVLWTLIPPCGALSLSCRWRCLRGVHVKERYAPERSSLVRIATLRTIVGEEVGPSSGLLDWSMLDCENTCSGKLTNTLQNGTVFQSLERLRNKTVLKEYGWLTT